MKKKLLATAIASAMIMPSAFAAQDNAGMHYTSASEGFYASLRVEYLSQGRDSEDVGANIGDAWGPSRFGVQGTNDLGGGMEGYYRYEAGISNQNGGNLNTRMAFVGLRGAFGQVQVGSFWSQNYNMLIGSTDVANSGSGNLYTSRSDRTNLSNLLRPGRANNSIEYTTPDLNGFQAAGQVVMDGSVDGNGAVVPGANKDDNELDAYVITGRYGVAGFDVAASYSVIPDVLGDGTAGKDDATSYALKVGYSQDNWYVNAWYAEDNDSDVSTTTAQDRNGDGDVTDAGEEINTAKSLQNDTELFSIAGGVSVGKVNVYAVLEARESPVDFTSATADDQRTIFGVQYNLGSRSRVWVDYVSQDLDSDTDADDYVAIGLRHDF